MRITERRTLPCGTASLPVFGLGCSPLGGLFRPMADDDALLLVHTAWDLGVRYFDTAPFYGYTRSERRLGSSLSAMSRAEFAIGTKVGRVMERDDSVRVGEDGWSDPLPFRPRFDYTRDGILRSFEESLQRCGLQRVELLLVHDIGSATHGDKHGKYWDQLTRGGGFRAMEQLRHEGRVGAIGLGVNEWQVAHQALFELDLDCTMLAGRYTLLDQSGLSPFLDDCLKRNCSVIAAGPFNSGVLVGGEHFDYARVPVDVAERVRRLTSAALEFGVPLAAAALQFPLAHPAVISCVSGAHEPREVIQNVVWFEQRIPNDFWQALRRRHLIDERAPLPSE